jgi:GT2 family glycosyltransferase
MATLMDQAIPGSVDVSEISEARDRIAELEDELKQSWKTIACLYRTIQNIESSHGFRWLKRYYAVRNYLFPRGSRRYRVAIGMARSFRSWAKFLIKNVLLGGWSADRDYLNWIHKHEPNRDQLEAQRQVKFACEPLISIIVPTYNTPARVLEDMLKSVLEQTYARWELCIADGASAKPEVRRTLDRYAGKDIRIHVQCLSENGGIVGNSNFALAMAKGDYVALLDHDDTLAPFALYEIVKAINDNPGADFIYSDEDKIDDSGNRRFDPHFKPDWSPDTLRSHNYICHLSVFARSLIEAVEGFRPGYDGSQDYDLILRATERAQRIVHVPKVLYHWRVVEGSTAGDPTAKMYAYAAARKAVASHLERIGMPGKVDNVGQGGIYRVRWPLQSKPLVSILIPTQDNPKILSSCIESLDKTAYKNYEIILVENHSTKPQTFALYKELEKRPNLRLLTWTDKFNYAAVNNFASRHAKGEILLFLNNDIAAINDDWLEEMLSHVQRPEVGVVGAKLYYPDDRVQHAGVIFGIGGLASHAHIGFPRQAYGYMHRLVITQNMSAVTGACMMMRKPVFDELDGFDERFVLAFNDLDLCLRARERGYLVIWTPFAELYHYESRTRGTDLIPKKARRLQGEIDAFQTKWGKQLVLGDPYYSPNLTLEQEDFALRA